ncbi:MAG: aminopeptidase P family protein [Chloroflexi bacterium]|jgi:Xaa-Pro aminopeptidase|nr:aminopeptidase P family protein [Chloroflexota bacterium]
MKSDLDRLMQEKNIDAILVTGPAQHNPAMYYMTGGGHLTSADLIKARGKAPVLFYNPMERDEAAATGLQTKNLTDYNLKELLKQTDGDTVRAVALRYKQMLSEHGLTAGRMALYGKMDVGAGYALFAALQKIMPDLEIVPETSRDSLLLQAMATKDEAEIAHIRQMGQITTEIVGRVAEFLGAQKAKNEVLVQPDGQPWTIGDVKRRINLWLAELGAENPEGTIFAIGRDAGVPHSSGTVSDLLRLGQTIVFDIFPCQAGGGYYYDFTRTWCLGYAPDAAQALYDDVYAVYQKVMGELQVNASFAQYQDRTCELFEAQGHPTIKSNDSLQEGYVHSLGHGLGLHVHERPWAGSNASQADTLAPGVVVTIEPGLYYPEKGMGCRLEDTVYVTGDGKMEILADFPLDLVIPIKR